MMPENVNQASATPEGKLQKLVLLTGMHRSGTSFLARRLHDGGLAFPGELLAPADDTPEGYWEARSLVRLTNEIMKAAGIDWKSSAPISLSLMAELRQHFSEQISEVLGKLRAWANGADFAIKDPRLCRLLPVWSAAAWEQGLPILLGATVRPASDVALSLYRRRRDPRFRPAAIDNPPEAILLWLRYMLDLEYHSRGIPRRFVSFDCIRQIATLADLAEPPLHADAAEMPGSISDSWQSIADRIITLLPKADAAQPYFDLARAALDQTAAGNRPVLHSCAYADRPTGLQRSGPVISFVSGEPGSRGHIYRVENRITALIGSGAASFRVEPERHAAEDIAALSDMVIIFRRQMDGWQDRLCRAAGARGVPVIFDVDDLVFDPELMVPELLRFLEGRPASELAEWGQRASRYQASVEAASQCWATTHPLAEEISRFNRNVSVLRNGLSDHHLREAARLQARKRDEGIAIGYASGTATHDRDFAEVAGALTYIMSKAPEVRLEIIGPLCDKALEPLKLYSSRILRRPKVDYFKLSEEVGRFDINIAPLENGNRFCAGKSELKFFEAGIVGVPTIASATPPFSAAIDAPNYGLVAQKPEDWERALVEFISAPQDLASRGEAAKNRSVDLFGPARQKRDILDRIAEHLPGFNPEFLPNKRSPEEAGLSLIEVLVALAITAAITVLIFSSLLSQIQQADIIRTSTRQAFDTVAARRLVETVVSSAVPAWSEDQEGAFRGNANEITGIAVFSLFGEVAKLQAFSLRIRQDGPGTSVLDISTEEGSWTVHGLPQSASFRYLGGDGSWHASWPRDMPKDAGLAELEIWFANQGLPRMITVWDEAEGAPGNYVIPLANSDPLSVRARDLVGGIF